MRLHDRLPGETVYVRSVGAGGYVRRRLLDLGLVPGTRVEVLFRARSGDPTAYRFRGVTVALRGAEASQVEVAEQPAVKAAGMDGPAQDPGELMAARDEPRAAFQDACTVALAGNPNTGKSTLFNALSGLRQHTGNWPGKTVTRAMGSYSHLGRRFRLVDLPGTYSLSTVSPDEEVARDCLLHERPLVAAVVLDATALERNLALALQVKQACASTVLCLNMMDEARRLGLHLNSELLASEFGAPVVPMSARSGQGIRQLKEAVASLAPG